ncbi:hypothetical protein NOZE110980_20275 [Nocardioides zeicaulis]
MPVAALAVSPRSGSSSLERDTLGDGAWLTGAISAVVYPGTWPARAWGVGSKRTQPDPGK